MSRGTQVPLQLLFDFRYEAVTLFGSSFQKIPLSNHRSDIAVLQPRNVETFRFRLVPVRSPLLWESRLISLPTGTEMFHFPALALLIL